MAPFRRFHGLSRPRRSSQAARGAEGNPDYAREFFVERNYRKWESLSLSGSEFLRLQILKALDSFHSRLYSIEAIRRAGDFKPYMPPTRRPGL